MRFTFVRFGPVAIFRLTGVLGAGSDLGSLHTAVGRLLDPTIRGVFLDMTPGTQLDCTGMGELVQFRNRALGFGRAFGLVHVEPRQHKLLEMAGLAAVLGVYDSDDRVLVNIVTAERSADRSITL